MKAQPKHARVEQNLRKGPPPDAGRPRIVLIEDNPLTAWAVEQTLSHTYGIVRCSTLEEARRETARHEVRAVICGSPIADDAPEQIGRFSADVPARVVALISRPECAMPAGICVLEKPFDLTRLVRLLAEEPFVETGPMTPRQRLENRLRERFEKEVCPVCIHKTADGGCTMTQHSGWTDCPVFFWARQLTDLVKDLDSERLSDYLDRIQEIICPGCRQRPDGTCDCRSKLDCPVDLYSGIVIPIIEEELHRMNAAKRAAGP